MAWFKLNLTHKDAIESHQQFYEGDFEVMPMKRRGYFDIFPLNLLIAYADFSVGGAEWDGIISTDGKKIVVTKSGWANEAKHRKVFECSPDEINSVTARGSAVEILFHNNVEGLTMARGNYFLKYIIFICTLALAFIFARFLFKGKLLKAQLKNEFKNREKFVALLKRQQPKD